MSIDDMLKSYTDLGEVQRALLLSMYEYLPFGEAISAQEMAICVFGQHDTILMLGGLASLYTEGSLGQQTSLYQEKTVGSQESLHQDSATEVAIINTNELPLVAKAIEQNQVERGMLEITYGRMANLFAFPIVDNGGKCIGALTFVYRNRIHLHETEQIDDLFTLAETTYQAIMVPAGKDYRIVSPLDGVMVLNHEGIIIYANSTARRLVNLLGFDRRILGASIYGSTLKLSMIKAALQESRAVETEELYGDLAIGQILIPLAQKERRSFLILQDRTVLRQKEQELLVKNSVIKEIHHRVKNNLQSVSGLLRMQARRSQSDEVKAALNDSIRRMESMALVHEIVSNYDEDYISLRKITDELFRLLQQALQHTGQHIHYEYSGLEVIMASHRATYVSLVLNEIISNCFKHAFTYTENRVVSAVSTNDRDISHTDHAPDRMASATTPIDSTFIEPQEHVTALTEGYIYVDVSGDDREIRIAVRDTGKGIPDDFETKSRGRLGIQIMRNLVENELAGHIEWHKLPFQETELEGQISHSTVENSRENHTLLRNPILGEKREHTKELTKHGGGTEVVMTIQKGDDYAYITR